jgi:segregation and condensation protein B
MNQEELKNTLEAAMFAAGRPLSVDDLAALFESSESKPERKVIREALDRLAEQWQDRGIELKQVASGYRFQVRKEYSGRLGTLWSERPPRYTRALMETLALIVYRQPITRGEIEDVRGVSVSPSIIKTLTDRDWIRVLGHRDVPGRPELFGTTRQFLDSFNLKSLDELPPLSEIKDFDNVPDDLFATVPLLAVVEAPQSEGMQSEGTQSEAAQSEETQLEETQLEETRLEETRLEETQLKGPHSEMPASDAPASEEEHDETRADGEPVTSDAG